jgi:hypothetical protein
VKFMVRELMLNAIFLPPLCVPIADVDVSFETRGR